MTRLEQSEFYKQAKNAYAVVHTGETALYGNIMLEKGLVKSEPKETATEKYEGSKYNRHTSKKRVSWVSELRKLFSSHPIYLNN